MPRIQEMRVESDAQLNDVEKEHDAVNVMRT